MVFAALALEIPIRAFLMASAGRFVAYMLFTNWAAVFLLGMVRGSEDAPAVGRPFRAADAIARREAALKGRPAWNAVALLAFLAAWASAMQLLPFEPTFPLQSLNGWPTLAGLAVRLGERVAALLRHHGAALRSDAAPEDDAGAGGVHRPQLADHLPRAHARLLRADRRFWPHGRRATGRGSQFSCSSACPASACCPRASSPSSGRVRCAGPSSNGSTCASGSANTPAWRWRSKELCDEAARRRDRALLQLR